MGAIKLKPWDVILHAHFSGSWRTQHESVICHARRPENGDWKTAKKMVSYAKIKWAGTRSNVQGRMALIRNGINLKINS